MEPASLEPASVAAPESLELEGPSVKLERAPVELERASAGMVAPAEAAKMRHPTPIRRAALQRESAAARRAEERA